MKAHTMLRLGVAAVIGVPIIGLNLWAFGAWATFEEAFQGEGNTTVPAPLAAAGKGVFGAWVDYKIQNEKADILDPESLNRSRYVSLDTPITLEDVLAPGEAKPAPHLQRLTLLARAPAFAMRECPRILDGLATSCAISKLELSKPGAPVTELRVQLAYVPADPAGDTLDGLTEGELRFHRASLRKSGSGSPTVPAADLPGLRASFYQGARDRCAELRDQTGNCVVAEISITESADQADPDAFQVDARATLAWFTTPENAGIEVALADSAPDVTRHGSIATGATSATTTGGADSNSGWFNGMFDGEASDVADVAPSAPVAEPPKVLNGGGAFNSAGEARFRRVDGN
jgi:hypothetical protein